MFVNLLAVAVYVAVGLSSALLFRGTRASRHASGGRVHDMLEAAFLYGGPARAADTALAAMQADGRLAVGGPGIVSVVRPVAHDPVERAVVHEAAVAPNGALHTLRFAVMRNPAVQEIGDGLAARGLMLRPGTSRTWRTWGVVQLVSCALVFPLSIALTVVEYAGHDRSTGLPFPFVLKVLPAWPAGLIIGIVCLSAAGRRVTASGRRAAGEFRAAHVHDADAGHRVALRGVRGLTDPVFRRQLMTAAAGARAGGSHHAGRTHTSDGGLDPAATYAATGAVMWCAASGHDSGGSGGGGCGGAGGDSCGSSGPGGSCGGGSGGGSGCGSSSGSGCGGGSSCGGGGSD
ncbi:TIGR04222 domain-containing membrane protein [Streptomyces sp. NPDC059169]|uniref:TIGR04222 domain-containing membrane protein n=1 Tax=Streptomyces sp. NPDC059169 TaxID=3346754 RepID=UPI003694821E